LYSKSKIASMSYYKLTKKNFYLANFGFKAQVDRPKWLKNNQSENDTQNRGGY